MYFVQEYDIYFTIETIVRTPGVFYFVPMNGMYSVRRKKKLPQVKNIQSVITAVAAYLLFNTA
jgi:hypothetical protein